MGLSQRRRSVLSTGPNTYVDGKMGMIRLGIHRESNGWSCIRRPNVVKFVNYFKPALRNTYR